MMITSAGIGVVCGLIGLYVSYYVNVASGPAIVLVETLVFAIAFAISRRWPRRQAPAPRPGREGSAA
jgi:ABC-type Mn2+/Zn2+ transport system permease subunit